MYVLGARFGYVAIVDAYLETPWTAPYLWPPGYLPCAGMLAAGWTLAVRLARRASEVRRHAIDVFAAAVAGLALFGTLAFVLRRALTPTTGVVDGSVIPDFELRDLDGAPVRL